MLAFAGAPSQRRSRARDRRCPSGAGRDRAPPASDRGRKCGGVSPRLLACDSLVGSFRKERGHPHDRASPKGGGREELCAWATTRRVSGVRAITWSCSRFVSIAEVDKRRLASAAWIRPRRSGLAPPARADGGRKRVGSRPSGGKAAGTVAGHDESLRKRASRGTCRGKALRAAEIVRFDERVEEVALALQQARETELARSATRGVRGCSSVAHAVDNAAARCSCSGGGRALSRASGTCQPKLEVRRQAASTGGRLAAR